MSWLLELTIIPFVVVVGGLFAEFIAWRVIGEEHSRYAAFALVVGYILARAQPETSEAAFDLPSSVGALIGLMVLWWHLFKREKARG